jgi:hypothetical protein
MGVFRVRGQSWLLIAAWIGLGIVAGLTVATARGDRVLTLDRVKLHRLDIVDDKGVVRLTLASPTPAPLVGGKAYKRQFPASGLVLYDANGDERGGMAVADVPGSAPVLALDHANTDAIGWRVMPDGSISFGMFERPPLKANPATGRPAIAATAASRVNVTVAADGTPTLSLGDKDSHPRVRISVTPEGYGEIEFLDAQGKVVSAMVPERGQH